MIFFNGKLDCYFTENQQSRKTCKCAEIDRVLNDIFISFVLID